MINRLALCFIALLMGLPDATCRTVTDSLRVNFRFAQCDVDTAFMDNDMALCGFARRITLLLSPDSGYSVDNASVIGTASPEGSPLFNANLSRHRAEALLDAVRDKTITACGNTAITAAGADWAGLARMAGGDVNLPFRDEVMAIVSDVLSGSLNDVEASRLLSRLHDGVPYGYLRQNIFPHLRTATLSLSLTRPDATGSVLNDAAAPIPASPSGSGSETAVAAPVQEAPTGRPPLRWALKTNMLYDVLAVPNIGVEFYLGHNLSVTTSWMYAWWSNDGRHRYWRTYGGDLALRRWFGRRDGAGPLSGHHLGIYAGVLTYDFCFGNKGYMGGKPGGSILDRLNYVAAAEYGYSLPVSRRLNIDFSIALGYMGGRYHEYRPVDDHYVWLSTRNRRWFGPVKAEVSLVWLLGRDSYNNGKGGRR